MEDRLDQDIELSLSDLFELIKQGLIFALAVASLAALATYFLSRSIEPRYQARATVLAAQTNPELRSFGVSLATVPSLDVSAYRTAAQSAPVIMNALASLGVTEANTKTIYNFRDNINVRTEDARTSSLIYIDVVNTSAALAADIANAIAKALVDWDTGRASKNIMEVVTTLEQQITALDEQIATLQGMGDSVTQDQLDGRISLRAQQQEQLYYARALSNSAKGLLDIIEPAMVPLNPVSPKPKLNAALAFVLGLFLSYLVVFLRSALDTRLRGSDDLAKVTGLPVLAEFQKQSTGMRRLPREASSYLRTNLLFATADAHPKVIVVSSASATEGKSSVAMSLAESFARSEYRTLLVDADLRKPVIGKEYNFNALLEADLRSYLEHPHESFTPITIPVGARQTLDVIPSFHSAPSPTELLTHGFRDRLDEWRAEYDAIIIDSAPLLPVADTLTIAPLCTGTLLVASLQNADQRKVRAAVDLLERIGVRTLGIVATNLPVVRKTRERYGYGYGYGYGEKEELGSQSPNPSSPAKAKT